MSLLPSSHPSVHPSIHPSIQSINQAALPPRTTPGAPVLVLVLGFASCMGERCWGRRAESPRGNCTVRPRNNKRHPCMFVNLDTCMLVCVPSAYCVCLAWLRLPKGRKYRRVPAVQRRAEKKGSHDKAHRASLSARSTAAVRLAFGGIGQAMVMVMVTVTVMDAWAALFKCTSETW